MRGRRYSLRLDDETLIALRRLAHADDRSMAAQVRILIRREAAQRGLWTPAKPVSIERMA